MSGIFISYRRSGASSVAYRLADELKRSFGEDRIFIDVESIDPGLKFAEAIRQALRQCTVTLVVIGPEWLSMENKSGQRRLDEPTDWVRQEVALALKSGTRLIPVLVEDAQAPESGQLPQDIADLAELQAFSISARQTHWSFDVNRLIDKLRGIDPKLPRPNNGGITPTPESTPYSYKVLSAVGIGLLIAMTAMVEGWEDSEEILGAAAILAGCVALCVAGYLDVKKGKTRGKWGAIFGAIFCLLVLLGSIAGLESADDHSLHTEQAPPAALRQEGGQSPPPAVASSDFVPGFGGSWSSPNGVSYHFQQSGREVTFREYNAMGIEVGQGGGEVDGETYYFNYYNTALDLSTAGSAVIDGNAMTIYLEQTLSGQDFSHVVYRQ